MWMFFRPIKKKLAGVDELDIFEGLLFKPISTKNGQSHKVGLLTASRDSLNIIYTVRLVERALLVENYVGRNVVDGDIVNSTIETI